MATQLSSGQFRSRSFNYYRLINSEKEGAILKTLIFIGTLGATILLSSCENYLGGFIGSGLVGLATYPLQRLVEAFQDGTDDFYEQELSDEKRRELEANLRLINRCHFVDQVELPEDFEGLIAALDQRSCLGCVPWGVSFECNALPDSRTEAQLRELFSRQVANPATVNSIFQSFENLTGNCCSTSCSNRCERLCPESAEIMSQSRESSIPYRENTLPIGNNAIDYGYCKDSNGDEVEEPTTCLGEGQYIDKPTAFNGVCHGHSTVRHNIATLAQWEPNEVPKNKQGQEITNADELTEFYSDIIKDLAKGRVRKVPGYSNVRDLTIRPDMSSALREAIYDQFHAQTATNPFMVESLSTVSSLDKEKFQKEISAINRNIRVSGTAQVTFGLGSAVGHTVEVYKTFDTTGNFGRPITIMCIIDSKKAVCLYGTGTRGRPCGNSSEDYVSINSPIPQSDIVDGVYCPRYVTVYKDDYSYQFSTPNAPLVKESSFDVDRQQDRTVRSNIRALSEFCKKERDCQ